MFDRIAPRYDFLNRVLSLGCDVRWRRRAVDLLDLCGPVRILDVCTGTADLLIEVLRRDPRHAGVGVDSSSGMLARGAVKLRRRGQSDQARLVRGDVTCLPFREEAFDVALAGFGIRNVEPRLAALSSLHRVLRPGGRLVVLEFSMPGGPFGVIYRSYFGRLLPRLAGVVSDRAAYAYLPASVERFAAAEDFARQMCEAGFEGVRWQSPRGRIVCLYRGEKG